ncbi:570_t:CDS:2, partial [Ambispora gerdemannii]
GFRERASFRGYVFEGVVHNVLQNGGSFRIRELKASNEVPEEETTLKLSPSNGLEIFYDIKELTKPKVYYIPYAKNFAAIDSIQLFDNDPDHFYQATVSDHHNVKNSIRSAIRSNKQIHFYFVVPKDVFPRFKYNQNFLNDNGTPYRNRPGWLRTITQFALEIDWDAYVAL